MKSKHSFSDIMLCFLFELLREIWGVIPAVILLILHFRFKLSLLYSVITFIIWLIVVACSTALIAFANKCSDEPVINRPNKNAHSAKTAEVFKDK